MYVKHKIKRSLTRFNDQTKEDVETNAQTPEKNNIDQALWLEKYLNDEEIEEGNKRIEGLHPLKN